MTQTQAAQLAKALREREVRPGSAAYAEVTELYEEAFPPEERIDSVILDKFANEPAVEYTAYYDEEQFCGFTYSINTDNYLYLLFLAVPANGRSRGYGTRILDQLKTRFLGRVIVLEIEPIDPYAPNAVQREKRLAFYRRNGFELAGYDVLEDGVTYTMLKTPGAFDAKAYAREVMRIVGGLAPFELIETPVD